MPQSIRRPTWRGGDRDREPTYTHEHTHAYLVVEDESRENGLEDVCPDFEVGEGLEHIGVDALYRPPPVRSEAADDPFNPRCCACVWVWVCGCVCVVCV